MMNYSNRFSDVEPTMHSSDKPLLIVMICHFLYYRIYVLLKYVNWKIFVSYYLFYSNHSRFNFFLFVLFFVCLFGWFVGGGFLKEKFGSLIFNPF